MGGGRPGARRQTPRSRVDRVWLVASSGVPRGTRGAPSVLGRGTPRGPGSGPEASLDSRPAPAVRQEGPPHAPFLRISIICASLWFGLTVKKRKGGKENGFCHLSKTDGRGERRRQTCWAGASRARQASPRSERGAQNSWDRRCAAGARLPWRGLGTGLPVGLRLGGGEAWRRGPATSAEAGGPASAPPLSLVTRREGPFGRQEKEQILNLFHLQSRKRSDGYQNQQFLNCVWWPGARWPRRGRECWRGRAPAERGAPSGRAQSARRSEAQSKAVLLTEERIGRSRSSSAGRV